jgi:hypothetical protein
VHLDTSTNDGRANLPVCPNLTASKRSNAAEPWGYARQNIAPLVLVEVWAARQRRPTLVVVSSCAPLTHNPPFIRNYAFLSVTQL